VPVDPERLLYCDFVERLRPRRLSNAERAERDRARQAAHDELTRREAEIAEVEQRIGNREIAEQQESANAAVWDAEYEVMEAKPATTAGAVALLRFVAEDIQTIAHDGADLLGELVRPIRRGEIGSDGVDAVAGLSTPANGSG
jgi:hypothetical protein